MSGTLIRTAEVVRLYLIYLITAAQRDTVTAHQDEQNVLNVTDPLFSSI